MPDLVICPCQHCSGKIEFDPATLSTENKKITCPHCSLETILFVPPPPDAKMKTLLSVAPPPPPRAPLPRPTVTEFDRVRNTADNFVSASKVIAILSFIVGFFGLINAEGYTFRLLGAGASGLGLSLWLYLVAQIMYIRAALEK